MILILNKNTVQKFVSKLQFDNTEKCLSNMLGTSKIHHRFHITMALC